MEKFNILDSDSYKFGHHLLYPKNTTKVYSYFESRGSKLSNKTLFFGLQYILKYLEGNVVEFHQDILEAREFIEAHIGPEVFDETMWNRIFKYHKGKLPISIKAVPEGTIVGTRNVLFTITNTDPKCAPLVNFLETVLSHVWGTTTVATNSRLIREKVLEYLKETGTESIIDYLVVDFGYRGVFCSETAGLAGMAHLVSSKVSDNTKGIRYGRKYYNTKEMLGYSITAQEHSTVTTWGKEHEADCYRSHLEKIPNGIIALVSDSYDIMNAVDNIWGVQLRDLVMSRNGTTNIRLDSGHAITTILKVLESLSKNYPVTTNSKGYKVLDSHIRILQGDGISLQTIGEILEAMKVAGWSADNIVFGSGGKLLQDFTRDTFNFAIKCSYTEIDGKVINVEKSPMEFDSEGNYIQSFKKSKKGLLKLVKDSNGEFFTATSEDPKFDSYKDELVEVFRDGKILKEYTFEEVRKNSGI